MQRFLKARRRYLQISDFVLQPVATSATRQILMKQAGRRVDLESRILLQKSLSILSAVLSAPSYRQPSRILRGA